MATDYPDAAAVARPPRTLDEKNNQSHLVVVLEMASLETVKTKKGYELLNSDDHHGYHRKAGRDPALSRPDICHQALLALLDSPLNKAGLLRVFVHTVNNILIEVSPHTRIPRTYKRFAGLMVQLLHKMRVRGTTTSDPLLKVIRNPITVHLPAGARVIGTHKLAKLVDPFELVASLPDDKPVVFVFGAMSKGYVEVDYVEEQYSFSQFGLSAATALNRLLAAFESKWDIL